MTQKEEKKWPLKLPRQIKFRGDDEMYELIARESYGRTGQAVFEKTMLGELWRVRLSRLRRKQRAMGLPDTMFYHPAVLKSMGIKPPRKKRPKREAMS